MKDKGTVEAYILSRHKEYVCAHTQNMLKALVVLAIHWVTELWFCEAHLQMTVMGLLPEFI